MLVKIGRTNGPSTDHLVESEFSPGEIHIILDTIAMGNKATNNKEKWFVETDVQGIVIPTVM